MHLSFLPTLVAAAGVSAVVLPRQNAFSPAPALPINWFNATLVKPLTLEEIQAMAKNAPKLLVATTQSETVSIQATCSNPRIRTEWDSLSNDGRQAFVTALRCLITAQPSKRFPNAQNRYEDLVALHQGLTQNVHNNHKFLVWHRYYLWTFEDILRSECGYQGSLPWFDESRYAGRFDQSSIFSNDWFGAIALGAGQCVTNGQFANLALNVGPGQNNIRHCLARNQDSTQTANTNSQVVSGCNANNDYASMATCAEAGAHAWGHNGIGGVMKDSYASPGDPVFWLHHAFIDRNYRIWQNNDASRVSSINGQDRVGNPLTLDTGVSVNGLRPDIKIRDILNTMDTHLCYKYNY